MAVYDAPRDIKVIPSGTPFGARFNMWATAFAPGPALMLHNHGYQKWQALGILPRARGLCAALNGSSVRLYRDAPAKRYFVVQLNVSVRGLSSERRSLDNV